MTIIIGIENDKGVVIGADTAISAWLITESALPKVFMIDDRFLFGGAGTPRANQLLRFGLEPKQQRDDEDDLAYLVTTVIPDIRQTLARGGALQDNDGMNATTNAFLMGYRGKLYNIDSDFQISRNSCGYSAVGSGSMVAMGAMSALTRTKLSPSNRVQAALEITAQLDIYCAAPFTILSIGGATT